VIDVVAVLTESVNLNRYWNTLKSRLQGEGAADLLGQIRQLKLQSRDNRLRLTDVASRETLLRIIQSIPSGSCFSSSGDGKMTREPCGHCLDLRRTQERIVCTGYRLAFKLRDPHAPPFR
jgi:hypothetical protein